MNKKERLTDFAIQDPESVSHLHLIQYFDHKEKLEKKYDNILLEGSKKVEKKLNKTLHPFIKKIKKSIKNTKNILDDKKERKDKILGLLRARIFQLKDLKITLDEFIYEKPFPTRAFEKKHSKKFLRAVKENNIKLVEELLDESKFLIHDYDHVNL